MSDGKNIRIFLIDDHTLFRSGLRLLLQRQPGFEVVGEAADGFEGVKRAKAYRPDVILLDLNMPGLNGLDTLQLLRQDLPEVAVIILTVSEEGEALAQALAWGAQGYLLKNIEAEALTEAIYKAVRGESVIAQEMTTELVGHLRRKDKPAPRDGAAYARLTPREREIVLYLARGESNKDIARSLDLAESTVKIHVQNVLKKLELTSRVQVAIYAIEHGLN